MWYEYVEPITGGTTTFAELTDAVTASIATTNTSVSDALAGKQPLSAVLTGTTATFTTALESKLDGIEAGATGDQDLSGLLTISTAASTYAPISHTQAIGTITGLGTNVATALAINADATGGIFRQGQALSATTVTASGAVSVAGKMSVVGIALGGSATTPGTNNIEGNGYINLNVNGVNKFGVGGSLNTSYQTLHPVDNNARDLGTTSLKWRSGYFATLIETGNLTASGTVTAAQYLYTTALFVTESTTARTLTSADHGKTIVCTNASAVTITLNTGLPTCFFVTIIQKGAGQVTVSGTATLEVFTGFAAKTAGQHAQMSVSNYGTSNVYHVAGQLGT